MEKPVIGIHMLYLAIYSALGVINIWTTIFNQSKHWKFSKHLYLPFIWWVTPQTYEVDLQDNIIHHGMSNVFQLEVMEWKSMLWLYVAEEFCTGIYMCCTLLFACNVPNAGCTDYLQDQLMDNISSFSMYPLLLIKNTDASDVMWVAICMQSLDSNLDIRNGMFILYKWNIPQQSLTF